MHTYVKMFKSRNGLKCLGVFMLNISLGMVALTTSNSNATPNFCNVVDQKVYYAESWKKGLRQIKEQKLTIKLNRKKSKYFTYIKDASGKSIYQLQANLVYFKLGDSGCRIDLHSLEDKYSVMTIYRGNGDSIPKENYYGFLYPVEESNWRKTGFFGVPLSSKRVFKIESFYCVIQTKSCELNPGKWRFIESIEVEIEFTNNFMPEWKQT
jgi:hypothetical protein